MTTKQTPVITGQDCRALAHELIDSSAKRGFYGSVIARYQNGRVTQVISERSYRADSIPQHDISEDYFSAASTTTR